ncbi:hypothetical protein [Nannocystis punicea]|uniref:Uncharacterized protein n=1 Tax=Nannocystis punicea TaxID=2995304 RepID=A0ABY7H090_9BACT|nr:hypothetical protein [Nannocystis poenicansa]WAS92648.1 hypothetical protein O0S08_41240 [Nannocystis poenicansa]
MQIEQDVIDAWIAAHAGKQGDQWPSQRTLRAILRDGELHRHEEDAHVLVCRSAADADAHLITTARKLAEELSEAELKFIKATLAAWKPKTVWLAWLQRDVRMGREHEVLLDSSGLRTVTRKKISGWAISVGVTMADLEALMAG